MESDDLSFIEISGEDDSLLPLQETANDDVSGFSKNCFACSPLQMPRSACSVNAPPPLVSPIAGITGNGDTGKLDWSLIEDSTNKENVSFKKPELPKLNMESQPMKRKKKGGFNLRKSLAWNKAFFTEEGVLDPVELSIITGNPGNSSEEMLSIVEEDGTESLAGNSEDLTALEEKWFKELPGSTQGEDIKTSGTLLQKNGSPAGVNGSTASAGKRKVLSAHDVNRSASKRSGCPRPTASSSLKRPASGNTPKSTTKEFKVSRVPLPARKLDTSLHTATAKTNIPGMSKIKRNQISKPVCIQRNDGSKVASNSVKSARSDARSGSTGRSTAVKSSVQQARSVTNSVVAKHSSVKSQHSFVNKTKNDVKIRRAPPPSTSVIVSNNHDGDSGKVPHSFPTERSVQCAQIQTAKPSGLRMPSPSLGFFNQSKISTLQSLLPRSNKVCNVPESSIPNFRNFGASNATRERPRLAPGKVPDMVNVVTASDKRIPKSISGSSISTNLSTDPQGETKYNLDIHEIRRVGMNVPSNSKSSCSLNNQHKLHSLCSDIDKEAPLNVRPSRNDKISSVVNNKAESNDVKLLFQRAASDLLTNDGDDGNRVANIYPTSLDLSGEDLVNPYFLSNFPPTMPVEGALETQDKMDSQCMEEKAYDPQIKNHPTSSELQSGNAIIDTINVTLQRQDDNEKFSKRDEEMMPCTNYVSMEGQNACLNNSSLSKELRSSDFDNCQTAKSSKFRRRNHVAERSHSQHQSEDAGETKDCEPSIDNICAKSLDSDVLDKVVVDHATENLTDACGSELTSSAALCLIPTAEKDKGFRRAGVPHGDDTVSYFTDTQLILDNKDHGLTTSRESDMIGKDQSTNMDITAVSHVSNVCPNSEYFSGCEIDLQHFEEPSAPVQTENGVELNEIVYPVKVKSSCVIDDANEHKGVGNNPNDLCFDSDLQPTDGTSFNQHKTSMVYHDQLSVLSMGCRQSLEDSLSPKASNGILSEDDNSYPQLSTLQTYNERLSPVHVFRQQSTEGIQITKVADENLSQGGMSVEEDRNQRGLVHPHNEIQHEQAGQGIEEIAGLDETIKKSLVKEAQIEFLEGNLLADSDNCIFNAVVANDIHDQSRVHSKLRDSDFVQARGPLDAQESCLDDKLIMSNCSSQECGDNNVCENLMDDVVEESDACTHRSNSPMVGAQVVAAVREDGTDNELKNNILPEEAGISHAKSSSNHEIQYGLKNHVFATEGTTVLSSGGVFEVIDNVLKNDNISEDAETGVSQKNSDPNCEMQCESETAICHTEDTGATDCLKKSRNDEKQDNLVLKPPSHAAPFSDEWLAAIEAAGEEILTIKSGAVQHSPPDKALPEPGPWSPVKRKNNQGIGPFDCTKKISNGGINTPPSSST